MQYCSTLPTPSAAQRSQHRALTVCSNMTPKHVNILHERVQGLVSSVTFTLSGISYRNSLFFYVCSSNSLFRVFYTTLFLTIIHESEYTFLLATVVICTFLSMHEICFKGITVKVSRQHKVQAFSLFL